MLIYGRNQHNIVKQLAFNLKKKDIKYKKKLLKVKIGKWITQFYFIFLNNPILERDQWL